MPTYDITSPDGRKFRVEAPAGVSKEDVLRRTMTHSAPAPENGAVAGMKDLLKSIPTGVGRGLANQMSDMGNAASIEMSQPNNPQTKGEDVFKQFGGERLHAPESGAGKVGESIGEALGSPATYMGPGAMLPKVAAGVGGAIGSELAGEAAEGSGMEVPARLAGGVAGGLAPRVGMRGVTPLPISPERQATVDTLRRAGVNPTAGDVTGRRALRYGENILGDAPGAGNKYTQAKERVGHEFTRAIAQRGMGEDADALRPEVFQRVERRLGQAFDRAARVLPIVNDQNMGNSLTNIRADMMREGLPHDTIRQIDAEINFINNSFTTSARQPNGVMPGDTYQAITRHGAHLQRMIDSTDPNLAHYAVRLRTALDDAMERTANARGTRPGVGRRQALEDLREARRQWYNMIVLKKSVAGPGEQAAEGLVSPQKLRQNLTGSQDSKMQYAAGRGGGLQDLARAGNEIMTVLPNSGTAQRTMGYGMAGGTFLGLEKLLSGQTKQGLTELGMVGAPAAAGRVGMSRPVQAWLSNQRMADIIRQLPPGWQDAARAYLNSAIHQPWDEGPKKGP